MGSAGPVLVVTGPCGVGKTTAMFTCSELLQSQGVPHACVDMDALRNCYPSPPGDRFHSALGLRNLSAVWVNYAAAGARRLILADVVESPAGRAQYAAAVPGATVTIARLRAPLSTIADRLRGRESGDSLRWHVNRAGELTEIMDREAVGDFLVDTDARSREAIALEILRQWERAIAKD
jgi:broad-specificity NMP kinase